MLEKFRPAGGVSSTSWVSEGRAAVVGDTAGSTTSWLLGLESLEPSPAAVVGEMVKSVVLEASSPLPEGWQGLGASALPVESAASVGAWTVTVTSEVTVVVTVFTEAQLEMSLRSSRFKGPAKASCARTSADDRQCLSISCGSYCAKCKERRGQKRRLAKMLSAQEKCKKRLNCKKPQKKKKV